MQIEQLSVFLENRPGTLVEVLGVLAAHQVNIRAMSVADTADFGIVRLIVQQPEQVAALLRAAHFSVRMTPVLALSIADQPGGLLAALARFREAGINIEYFYAFASGCNEQARIVLKVDDICQAVQYLETEYVNGGRTEPPGFYW